MSSTPAILSSSDTSWPESSNFSCPDVLFPDSLVTFFALPVLGLKQLKALLAPLLSV